MQRLPQRRVLAPFSHNILNSLIKSNSNWFGKAIYRYMCACMLVLSLSGFNLSHGSDSLININLAPATELAKNLPGIGPAKATAIVRYREQHGPFKTIDALVNVKGIGPGILAKIKALVAVGNADNNDGTKQPVSQQGPTKTFAQHETAAQHAVRAALSLAAKHAAQRR